MQYGFFLGEIMMSFSSSGLESVSFFQRSRWPRLVFRDWSVPGGVCREAHRNGVPNDVNQDSAQVAPKKSRLF